VQAMMLLNFYYNLLLRSHSNDWMENGDDLQTVKELVAKYGTQDPLFDSDDLSAPFKDLDGSILDTVEGHLHPKSPLPTPSPLSPALSPTPSSPLSPPRLIPSSLSRPEPLKLEFSPPTGTQFHHLPQSTQSQQHQQRQNIPSVITPVQDIENNLMHENLFLRINLQIQEFLRANTLVKSVLREVQNLFNTPHSVLRNPTIFQYQIPLLQEQVRQLTLSQIRLQHELTSLGLFHEIPSFLPNHLSQLNLLSQFNQQFIDPHQNPFPPSQSQQLPSSPPLPSQYQHQSLFSSSPPIASASISLPSTNSSIATTASSTTTSQSSPVPSASQTPSIFATVRNNVKESPSLAGNPLPELSFKIQQLLKQAEDNKEKDHSECYPCPDCGKKVASRHSFQRHLKLHAGLRPYVCDFPNCRKKFPEKSTLERHIRIHTGERPFQCEHEGCTKSFSDASNLRRHRSIHTGYKPYRCHCGRVFSRKISLKKHYTTVHSQEVLN
jgi:hypothetical protein